MFTPFRAALGETFTPSEEVLRQFRLNDINHVKFYFHAPLVEAIPGVEARRRELIATIVERKARVSERKKVVYELAQNTCPVLQDVLDDLATDFSAIVQQDTNRTPGNSVANPILEKLSRSNLTAIRQLFNCFHDRLIESEPSENETKGGIAGILICDIPVAKLKMPVSEHGSEIIEVEAYARLTVRQRVDGILVISGEYLNG